MLETYSCLSASQMFRKTIVVIMTTGVLAGCGAGANDSTSVQDLLVQGQKAQSAHRDVDCIAIFSQALKRESTLVAAYVGRASCYVEAGNPAAAVHDYSQALARSPEDPSINLGRASAEEQTGNYSGSKNDFIRAGTLNSANPTQIVQAAEGLGHLGFYEDAGQVLNQGIKRYPNYWDLHRYRGELQGVLGNDVDALAEFQSALTLGHGANLAFILDTRANFYRQRQQFGLALADYDRAVKLDPDQYWLFAARARVQMAAGGLKKAELDFSTAIRLMEAVDPQSGILAGLLEERGKVFIQEGLKLQARDDLQEALRLTASTDTSTRTRLAALIASLGL